MKDYSNKFPWSMWNEDPIWHSDIDNYETFDYKNYSYFSKPNLMK